MTPVVETVRSFGLRRAEEPPGFLIAKRMSREDLCDLFRRLGYIRGAEIGVWSGEFSRTICKRIPGVQLTCVDAWQAYGEYQDGKNDQARMDVAYQDTVARLLPFKCRILRMRSSEAADQVPDGSLDFVYIDSNHAKPYVLEDLQRWVPKVRSGGIVSGHDYLNSRKKSLIQVKDAIDEYTAAKQIAPVYVLTASKSPSWFWEVA